MTVLAASAVSGNALASPIPQEDIGLQTLGGKEGTKLPVGTFIANSLWKQLDSISEQGGKEDGQTDDYQPNTPTDLTDNGGNQGNLPVSNDPAVVPEPGILGIFGAGLVALGLYRRRRG
jgi:hypothetical protein